jgi:transposase
MGAAIYSDEFKREAVKQVVEGGHQVRDVAKRLGVSDKSIYTWLKESPGRSRAAKQAESLEGLRSEVGRLKAELKRTKEERDILRKAAAYFAKASE